MRHRAFVHLHPLVCFMVMLQLSNIANHLDIFRPERLQTLPPSVAAEMDDPDYAVRVAEAILCSSPDDRVDTFPDTEAIDPTSTQVRQYFGGVAFAAEVLAGSSSASSSAPAEGAAASSAAGGAGASTSGPVATSKRMPRGLAPRTVEILRSGTLFEEAGSTLHHSREMDMLASTAVCGKLQVLQRILTRYLPPPEVVASVEAASRKALGYSAAAALPAVASSNKVLIFSKSVQLLTVLQNFLQTRTEWGRHVVYTGNDDAKKRNAAVRAFQQKPDVKIMLLSVKAGGVGLNLTAANVVVIFDPSWNPATDAQAQDRAYRIGQSQDVTVYRLLAQVRTSLASCAMLSTTQPASPQPSCWAQLACRALLRRLCTCGRCSSRSRRDVRRSPSPPCASSSRRSSHHRWRSSATGPMG